MLKVGDQVLCLEGVECGGPIKLVKDNVYTVGAVCNDYIEDNSLATQFIGLEEHGDLCESCTFAADRFIPTEDADWILE